MCASAEIVSGVTKFNEVQAVGGVEGKRLGLAAVLALTRAPAGHTARRSELHFSPSEPCTLLSNEKPPCYGLLGILSGGPRDCAARGSQAYLVVVRLSSK